jgi:lipopolysaccharide transport system ATP-binding protein
MTTRLAFAGAAHLDPEILIIDEVLAVGDAAFQKKCLGRMSEVARAGRTVLFVSHNMSAVTALCSRGLYLERGALKASGPMEGIAEQYLRDALPANGTSGFHRGPTRGSGQIIFTDAAVGSENVKGTVACGDGTRIWFKYEAEKTDLPAHFLVNIFDRQQGRVLSLDSKTASNLPEIFPKHGELTLDIPSDFSLTPGRYSLELCAFVNGEVTDHIPGALEFEVQDADFYGNGRKSTDPAAVLVKTKWSV